ncbi:MAG: branched-chain amino acid ABC transporter permease [Candidatus Binatia bacterium]
MTYVLQQSLNALQLGSIYALIALGYTLVYGVLRLINFAHGDLFMAGAFLSLVAGSLLGLPAAVVFALAVLGTGLLAVLIERVAYRPLRDAPRVSAVITALACGLVLEHVVLLISPYPQHVPPLFRIANYDLGGVVVSSLQLLIVGIALALMLGLDWIFRHTLLGIAMRAIARDMRTLPLLGVPVNRVVAAAFLLGGGLGGAAGMLYGQAYPVIEPYMGIMVGWKAFISAVVGGIGNIRGAMLGGYILGALEIAVVAFFPSTYRDFVAFTLLVVLLIFRPTGLLGVEEVQKV